MELKDKKSLEIDYPVIRDWVQNIPSEILQQCRVIKYSRGKALFHRGDPIHFVYIICEGTIMISSSNLNGNEMSIVFVKQGYSVGEMEVLIKKENLFYNAKAFSKSVLLEIPAKAFKHWIDTDTVACKKIATVLAEKLYSASSSTVEYKHLEATMRVKMLLSNYGQGRVQETKEELAEACGVSERTIHRVLTKLLKEKLISRKKGKIEISETQLENIEKSILEQVDRSDE